MTKSEDLQVGHNMRCDGGLIPWGRGSPNICRILKTRTLHKINSNFPKKKSIIVVVFVLLMDMGFIREICYHRKQYCVVYVSVNFTTFRLFENRYCYVR